MYSRDLGAAANRRGKNIELLKEIILRSDTRKGRIFDLCIQALIIISLFAFSAETLPSLSDHTRSLLAGIEVFTIVVFTVEYLLRIFLTEKKLTYVFSFFGIIDLLTILPFYLSSTLGLQPLRILRLLRVFVIFKTVRYNSALTRIGKAIKIAKEELVLFSAVNMILIYLSALGIYYFEHAAQPEAFRSIFDSLWWAVATLTTVGYGDIYPITLPGRLFTFVILILGLGVVAAPTGIISSALTSVRREAE